jgi:hypothetical protein
LQISNMIVMQAYRDIHSVTDNKIIIELPPDFNHNPVEVIVLPVAVPKSRKQEEQIEANRNKQLTELLTVGVWDENDLHPALETKNFINLLKKQARCIVH